MHFLSWLFSLAAHCQFCRFFCTSDVPCCSSISSLLLFLVNKLQKFILFQRRHRQIWNQLPSVSFGRIYVSEGQNGTHLWWHCPFKMFLLPFCSVTNLRSLSAIEIIPTSLSYKAKTTLNSCHCPNLDIQKYVRCHVCDPGRVIVTVTITVSVCVCAQWPVPVSVSYSYPCPCR